MNGETDPTDTMYVLTAMRRATVERFVDGAFVNMGNHCIHCDDDCSPYVSKAEAQEEQKRFNARRHRQIAIAGNIYEACKFETRDVLITKIVDEVNKVSP